MTALFFVDGTDLGIAQQGFARKGNHLHLTHMQGNQC
jgi:hypothetical protein